MEPPTVLITGASGVVGRAIVEQLDQERLIGLVHEDGAPLEVEERHVSDLASPRLGLEPEAWAELAERTDAIVHSAALTEWGRPVGEYDAINVEGTRQVAELARLANAPVYYVGTAFSHAIARGRADRLAADNVVRPYVTSKLQAERVLEESGVPHSVFRPTNLVGDSRTGAGWRPQIVQTLSDWICRGKAPYLPAHEGNLIDVVPLDTLSVAVAAAVRQRDLGRRYWVTCGSRAPTVEAVVDLLVAHAGERGREIEPPPVVDPARGLPSPLAEVPPTSRAFLKVLIDVSEVTRECGGTLPTSLEDLHGRLGVPEFDPLDAYRRSLDYWARERDGVGGGVG
ncbi:MAG TPA: SDR family oxidoreductase [Solirubrobacterales bacterium]